MDDPISRLAEILPGRRVTGCERLSGGDLSAVYRLRFADGGTAIAKRGRDVAVEADMLRAIAASGAPAPEVLAVAGDLLLMQDMPGEARPGNAWEDLARMLSRLHAATGALYGWHADYAFGDVAIANAPDDDWPRFWAGHRLRCHLPDLRADLARRIERLADRIGEHLPAHPVPALLHGDLWGGNILVAQGRVSALIDPACYHGDREVDVAMLTVFDHPPSDFFEALALDSGWRARLPVYRLWPLLVHLRLFGESYAGAVAAELAALGA